MFFYDIKNIGKEIHLLTNTTLMCYSYSSVYLSSFLDYKMAKFMLNFCIPELIIR